jgi:nucleoside triphosphate pyrophosphatase
MDNNSLLKEKIILASKSPRRAEILRTVGWPFETIATGVDETRRPGEEAVSYVRRLARSKAEAAAAGITSGLVLGADTVVVADDEILGQPSDEEDARRMLGVLSGKWHEVLTGIALIRVGESDKCIAGHATTRVRFTSMSAREVDWYVATGEPMDKAGAYAVQGRAALFIEEIEGDYFNIVGLPVGLMYRIFRQIRGL